MLEKQGKLSGSKNKTKPVSNMPSQSILSRKRIKKVSGVLPTDLDERSPKRTNGDKNNIGERGERSRDSKTNKDALEERSTFLEESKINPEREEVPKNISICDYCDLNFEVPALHNILNRASKPTTEQRRLLKNRKIKIKYGRFDKQEDLQIEKNWKYFMEINGLEDKPEMFFNLDKTRITTKAKQIFLFYLSRDLPERTPYSVFRRFKILMSSVKSGRFSFEEDEYIKNVINSSQNSSAPVTEIAKELKRSRLSVEKKVKAIKTTKSQRSIKWRGRNAAAFIKCLLKVTGLTEERIEILKQHHISLAEWKKLSAKLDDVPVKTLQNVWFSLLYPALFIPTSVCDLKDIKLKLIEMLHENNETQWSKINWKKYAEQFEGMTSVKIYKLIRGMVTSFVSKDKWKNFKRCLKILRKLDTSKLPSHQFYKITYHNGEIVQLRPKTE